jgi:3-methyladenine DNA glycosylase AlkD
MKASKNMKTEFKNYQEAIDYFNQFKNEKKALFYRKMINSPKLHFHGLDTKSIMNVIKNYSLTEGPLDYSYELTSLIFASNIATINDDKALIAYLLEFIKHVDNWAHIDAIFINEKIKRLQFEALYPLIKHTRDSDLEFVSRFYYVAFIMYKRRVELYDDFLASIKDSEKYYTFMAIAWVLSEMFPQSDDKILSYLSKSSLSKKTKLKTIQKIKESRKTTDVQREKLEKLRSEIKGK